MRHSMLKKLSLAFVGGIFGLAVSFSAMAATPAGTLEGADSSSIYGWVWDSDSYGHVIPVEISVYPQDSSEAIKTATIKADHYQENSRKASETDTMDLSIPWTGMRLNSKSFGLRPTP